MPALVASAFFGAICPTSFERKVYMNKRWLRRMDFTLIFATAAIILMSLVIIGSATHINTAAGGSFVQRQGLFALVNIALAVFFMNFDYKMLQRYGMTLYWINLALLVAVMLFGHSALGAQRWIQIGPISLQPSEFSKIIMIISLAALLEDKVGKLNTLHDLLPIAAFVGVPFLLVLKQPDLGTSLVFIAIFLGMIFAVVGEELGFVGAAFLLIMYLILLWRGIKIARDASDTFGMLLAVGITSMLVFHVLVNIGMTMGIMPVTGIPLPLMSYGISSLTTNIMSIAILLNVYMKKQRLVF